ncbi:hypothetical protein N7520_004861, partial [Penicillium odoratum]|uniref:uncharacterized protein n=1 Tax=Penicillium odoratum TaxID=1167516 RepID=UPI0025479826
KAHCGGEPQNKKMLMLTLELVHYGRRGWEVERLQYLSKAENSITEIQRVSFLETSPAYRLIQSRIESHSLVHAFLSNCFPPEWVSWITLLGQLPTKAETLEISTVAVAASAVGTMFHMPDLVQQGHRYYIQGLRQLQRSLNDPLLMREDGTLAACMALSLYEALECPTAGSEGYFSHCQGIMALMQARGVNAHTSGAGHQLFLGLRVPGVRLILYALQQSTSTSLSESIWMEEPWAGYPKSSFDRVTDCFAHAPGILERVKTIPSFHLNQQLALVYELVQECWQVDKSLDAIYDEIQNAPGPLYWPIPSQNIFDFDADFVRNVLWFSNISIARTLILLWAMRTMLWSGLCNLYKHAGFLATIEGCTPVTGETGLPSLGHREDYISMAYHVCQSVEYFLQNDMLLAGPISVSPALGIVLDGLQHRYHPQEVAWLQSALKVVRGKGLRALEYVT